MVVCCLSFFEVLCKYDDNIGIWYLIIKKFIKLVIWGKGIVLFCEISDCKKS